MDRKEDKRRGAQGDWSKQETDRNDSGSKEELDSHVLRGDGLMLEVTEARMIGKRGRGRKKILMIDELIEEFYVELKRKAQN